MGNNACKKRALAHAIESMGIPFLLWAFSAASVDCCPFSAIFVVSAATSIDCCFAANCFF